VAAVFRDQLSLLSAVRRRGLRGLREARERRRLARGVRTRAHEEREQCHRGGVIEFASVARRTALYERIAERLEDLDHQVAVLGVRRLERLLAEPPPYRDYGAAAKQRNARIESILRDLERGRVHAVRGENHAARVDGRAGPVEIDRSQRVERRGGGG
jgi:hypothetical protein